MCDQNNAFLRLLVAAQAQQTTPTSTALSSRSNGQRHSSSSNANAGLAALAALSNPLGIDQTTMLMWQQMMLFQAAQAQLQQQMQQSGEDLIKKLAEFTKTATPKTSQSVPTTSNGSTSTVKTPTKTPEKKLEAGEIPKAKTATPSSTSSNLKLDTAMWQFLAAQMLQQQQNAMKSNGFAKNSKSKREKRESLGNGMNGALDLSKNKSDPSSSDGTETRSTSTPVDPSEPHKKRPPATAEQARVPLLLGYRRQTCIRAVAASGVRGDVVYYAPCGKKLTSYAEVLRYLMKNNMPGITRDNFSFSSKLLVGEFVQPQEGEDGNPIIVKLTEEEVAEQVNKLVEQRAAKPERVRHREPKELKEKEVKPKDIVRPITPEELTDFYDLAESKVVNDEEGNATECEKVKWSREPVDDLLLTEIRPMPDLTRIPNMELEGEAFADALMVFEFMKNFGGVLSMDETAIPSFERFCAGLSGDPRYGDDLLWVTKTLFTLALEYPGLPSGKKGRTALGQSLSDIGMCRENYSALMRQFLGSRDEQGKKLAEALRETSFEGLPAENKAAILAYFCNELVCCRNIVKEIDNSLEKIGQLKGERWLRDGKARALRGHQKRKRREQKIHHDDDGDDRPASRNSDSDTSRPGTPTPNNKKLTPGLGQVEILTQEEESMTVEELDSVISNLKLESDELKDQINGLNNRVRSFPFGWDRYHRQYWQLPNVPTILVESIESAGAGNPACNITETCSKDPEPYWSSEYIDPDVLAVVEDLVDETVLSRVAPEKRKKKKIRRLENSCKRGWWQIESMEQLEQLRTCLHGRGIRERCMHRLLNKNWFLSEVRLGHWELLKCGEVESPDDVCHTEFNRLRNAICVLEQRVFDAQLGNQGWIPTPSVDEGKEFDDDEWHHDDFTPDHSLNLQELKDRLLACELAVERRYLRHNFYAGEVPSASRVLGIPDIKQEEEEKEIKVEPPENEEAKSENSEGKSEEEEPELIDIWRNFVAEAETAAELMLALQCLERSIAWERSISDACCQICKTSGLPEELLLCDGCQMGYHLQCFKPILPGVPQGEWFCPRCREQASGKPTCVLCQKEGAPIFSCRRCYNYYHLECSCQTIPDSHSDYICRGCDTKNFERKVILRGESEDRAEVEMDTTPAPETLDLKDPRRAIKRKADAPLPPVFPHHMSNDLCRTMLDELEQQPSIGPFLEPVDLDAVPGYREIIANPIDISVIRNKVECQLYGNPDDFAADMDLMFSNCRTFNEDDSPVGIAGQTLHKFYTKRWRQVKYNFSKRLRRLKNHTTNS